MIILSCLLVSSCSLGPTQLKGNRLDYNKSVQKSDSEELLLNLVRIRYSETPYFMQVSSISSSFNYSMTVGADGHFNQGQEMFIQYPSAAFLPSFGGTVSESPTITFSPLLGEEFVQQLLADITPSRFWFLHRAGWEMPMLLNLLTRSIGRLYNPDHYQLTNEAALRQRREFLDFVAMVEKISARGDFGLIYHDPTDDKPFCLIMQFRFADLDEAKKLETLLGAKLEINRLEDGALFSEVLLSEAIGLPKTSLRTNAGVVIPILLRNFIGVLVYLDSGVSPPDSHMEKGIVKTVGMEEAFDDPRYMLAIKSSNQPPSGALVAVNYHNIWFYLREDDFFSKRTFGFVAALLSLQSGKVTGTVPVLTLPVSK